MGNRTEYHREYARKNKRGIKRKDYIKNYMKTYILKDTTKEKIKEYNKKYGTKYRKINENKIKNKLLLRNYGITIEEYNKIFIAQAGCCKICNTHQSEVKKAFGVDHDHLTLKIRGILCDRCNLILGFANDDISILKNAIIYLSK